MVITMIPLCEWLDQLAKRTDVPKIVKLPRDTVVTVNGKRFRLMDNTYAMGTASDLAIALKPQVPNSINRLNMAFAALNHQDTHHERSQL